MATQNRFASKRAVNECNSFRPGMSSPDRSNANSDDGDPPDAADDGSRGSRFRRAAPTHLRALDDAGGTAGMASPASQSVLQQLQCMLRPNVRSQVALPSYEQVLWQRLDSLNAAAAEQQRRETLLRTLMTQPGQGRQTLYAQPSWANSVPSQLGLHQYLPRLGSLPSLQLGQYPPLPTLHSTAFSNPLGFAQGSGVPPPLPWNTSRQALSQPSHGQPPNRFLNYQAPLGTNSNMNLALRTSDPYLAGVPPDLGTLRPGHEKRREGESKQSHSRELEEAKAATRSEVKSEDSESSEDRITTFAVADRVFPSERSSLALRGGASSPREAYRIMKVLGSTLRSKRDPFIDAATLPEPQGPGENRVIRGSDRFFPDQLHSMLMEIEREGSYVDVVSFMPHGRAFRVHKKERFINEVLPRYFGGQGKWTSFLRQVKLYGFLRVSSGSDCNAYYHELFLRTKPELTKFMRRVGTPKGLDRRTYRIAEGEDPDFYSFPPLEDPASSLTPPPAAAASRP